MVKTDVVDFIDYMDVVNNELQVRRACGDIELPESSLSIYFLPCPS